MNITNIAILIIATIIAGFLFTYIYKQPVEKEKKKNTFVTKRIYPYASKTEIDYLSKAVNTYLARKNMTQKQLGKKLGVCQTTISFLVLKKTNRKSIINLYTQKINKLLKQYKITL